MTSLTARRLAGQHLLSPTLTDPRAIVSALGAVQAQDFAAAKWSVGQRTVGATDASVERAFDDGMLVRTHVLRPTWHFVAPADIRWMLDLTAPRVAAACAYQWRKMELDSAAFRRSNAALTKALRGGKHLTRAEITRVLASAKIDVSEPSRVGHLTMRAELDGVLCSGPRRGKQFTYALLDERVAPSPALDRDEALAELARRYFTTRGPATVRDFSWWSGLTVADARTAVDILDTTLERETIEGNTYWFAPGAPRRRSRASAHLLPNYDEYFIAFADRGAALTRMQPSTQADASALTFANIVVVDGQVVGTWRRTLARKAVAVDLTLRVQLNAAERQAVSAAVERYGAFLQLPAELRD